MNETRINYVKPMSLEVLCQIWQKQNKISRKTEPHRSDRSKTLSTKTLLNRYCKIDDEHYGIYYKDIHFTEHLGMGELTLANGNRIWGATISDFTNAVKDTYGFNVPWAKNTYYNYI